MTNFQALLAAAPNLDENRLTMSPRPVAPRPWRFDPRAVEQPADDTSARTRRTRQRDALRQSVLARCVR